MAVDATNGVSATDTQGYPIAQKPIIREFVKVPVDKKEALTVPLGTEISIMTVNQTDQVESSPHYLFLRDGVRKEEPDWSPGLQGLQEKYLKEHGGVAPEKIDHAYYTRANEVGFDKNTMAVIRVADTKKTGKIDPEELTKLRGANFPEMVDASLKQAGSDYRTCGTSPGAVRSMGFNATIGDKKNVTLLGLTYPNFTKTVKKTNPQEK